ncbi:terminase large subunit domain-containing protein [Dietzia sp. 179-F 9C3 NHS]|uniref:terminase large subunit domain-containing protein n=1 Tax=Dietzia sp. 179-F 9C3 NHS TaxID=3374295 RepID=UPI0038794F8F
MTSPPPPTAPPRFLTTSIGRTFGPAIARTGELLGTPFMPWQSSAADLIGAVDGRNLYAHATVAVSVPRQSGKTTMAGAVMVHRALTGPRRKIWYTAQTGQDARKRWLELVDAVQASPLRSLVTVKRTNGSEGLIFANGSAVRPFPPTEDALHGEQSDLVVLDEAWAFTEYEGDFLVQAIIPTQATRPGAQTLIVSTRGTAESAWFHNYVARGRAGDGVALIDYGIPDDADPDDLDTVAAWHPAYGHTMDRAALARAQTGMTAAQFARAYGNRATGARERLVDPAALAAADHPGEFDRHAVPLAFGAAVDLDRTETAIVAAAEVDGRPVVEVIEHRPGTAWAAPRLTELVGRWSAHGLVIDPTGPSSTLHDALDRAEVDLMPFAGRDRTTADTDLLDRLRHTDQNGHPDPLVGIVHHPALDAALDIVTMRRIGDGLAFSRRGSPGPIAVLEAASNAVYALAHRPAAQAAPEMRFA